ncbi:MAG: hypothetical protein AB7P34_09440 [Vicinamibacterales bacterium]
MTDSGNDPGGRVAELERRAPVPQGTGDRFGGYAVMGLTFAGGDVLALRRFPASSAGRPYTSVWHRSAEAKWTFYSDVSEHQGCDRYWGPLVDHHVVAPIRLEWTAPYRLLVSVDGGRLLSWSLVLRPTAATTVLNLLATWLPDSWWGQTAVLRAMAAAARALLGTGPMRLRGRTPSGHRFTSTPQALWDISSSSATLNGRDLGRPGPLVSQATLGEFAIPQRGLFVLGRVTMEAPHRAGSGR